MNNLNKIKECFEQIGIIADDFDETTELMDIIEESMTFITFIVEIENMFEIEIPDEYLIPGKLVSIDDTINMIENLSQARC